MLLTIFTPTFNRGHYLNNIYESLCDQNFYNFEWLIIDDGSTDDTKNIVDNLINKSTNFNIRYVYKENGGKHTAINLAAQISKGDFILWLDSDDIIIKDSLLPFSYYLTQTLNSSSIAAVIGLRVDDNMNPMGSFLPPNNPLDVYYYPFLQKEKIVGEYCWSIKRDILRLFPFPIYENENFITEARILYEISGKYKVRFVSIPVIKGDYLDTGLTRSLHDIVRKNPIGYLDYHNFIIKNKQSSLKNKLFHILLFWSRFKHTSTPLPKKINPTFLMRVLKYPSFLIDFLYQKIRKDKK